MRAFIFVIHQDWKYLPLQPLKYFYLKAISVSSDSIYNKEMGIRNIYAQVFVVKL